MNSETLPAVIPQELLPAQTSTTMPALLQASGSAAQFAWDEFFLGHIQNDHTRTAYERAVRRFMTWAAPQIQHLTAITPGMVATFIRSIPGKAPTRKLYLAALRQFFDVLVNRHAMILNPALSVKGERYAVADGEGLTPEISVEQVRTLMQSIQFKTILDYRDAAILGCLRFTGARVGAVASLTYGAFVFDGLEYLLSFVEKGNKQRRIPVNSSLKVLILDYLKAAEGLEWKKESPLFRASHGRTERLSNQAVSGNDIYRMMKRRLKLAKLPPHLVPHSIRACVVTDLLNQGLPLEDVQTLVGHADPRTTRLYDRRNRQVTRNLVERISI
ncbi:MAG: tyrosine-type recombinase/integrase [Gemmatales bacterium]